MPDIITTSKNSTYKYIKSLQQKKARVKEQRFTVEGIKSVSDAIRSDWNLKMVAVSEHFYSSEDYDTFKNIKTVIIKDELFDGLCETKTPQGIIAVIEMKDNTKEYHFKSSGLYVYCDCISDPGNLGTIIRTADAAGIDGVILSDGCVDLYSPKTVRSSMGSFFNIDVINDKDSKVLYNLKEEGFRLYSGVLSQKSKLYTEVDYTQPAVIIIGNEANGVKEEILSVSEHIIIPIHGSAESLNAAIAGAIIMYEAVKQRTQN
jgi:TrmH family RNA methyltransferase